MVAIIYLLLGGSDRALLVWMTRLWPSLLGVAQVVQPETILRWHRAGWKAFWRWKSRKRAGRPKIDRGLRDLIQRMSKENPLWGASRIHGELLMLGFEVAQSTVSTYMVRGGTPPCPLESNRQGSEHQGAVSRFVGCISRSEAMSPPLRARAGPEPAQTGRQTLWPALRGFPLAVSPIQPNHRHGPCSRQPLPDNDHRRDRGNVGTGREGCRPVPVGHSADAARSA